MGLGVLSTRTNAQAKKMIRQWVSKNISVKPRQMLQNMRFNQGSKRPQEVVENENENMDARAVDQQQQRRITDFFRKT